MRRNILTLFLLIFMISFTAQAQNRNQQERRPQMKERFEKRNNKNINKDRKHTMHARLQLTEDQEAKMETIRLDGKKAVLPFQNQLREKKAKMRTLSTGDTYDVKELNKLADEIADLQASVHKINILKKGEMRELLTEDQKVIFDTMPTRAEQTRKRGAFKKRR